MGKQVKRYDTTLLGTDMPVKVVDATDYDTLLAEAEALRKDAERYRWLAKRDRWASLLVDFDRHSTYRRHRVVFFTGDDWPQVEGQTIDEAVDAAMAPKEE